MKKRLVALLLLFILLVPSAVASAAYYRVNTSWLKVRNLPDSDATVLDSYRRDFALTIDKKYGIWSLVTFTNGKQGYVQTKYLKAGKSYTAYITTDKTLLRRGPATSFASVGSLAKGAKVTVLTHGASYDYVSTSVGRGYVRNSYLSRKKVTASGSKSTSGTIAKDGESYDAYVVNPNNRTVNLRRGPGKEYGILNVYRPGTGVTVLSAGTEWSKVKIDGLTGYMMSVYLSKTKPTLPPSEATPAPIVTPGPAVTPPYTAYVTSANGKSVNVHRGAGLGYANVTRLSVGTKVTVIGWPSKTWCQIQMDDGRTGYIMTKYLRR